MTLDDQHWSRCVEKLRQACEAGAAAAYAWVGRLDKERADADASQAMRGVLLTLDVATRVVAGEGAKDEVEHLEVGEVVGDSGQRPGLDLAVDPIEGTTNLAHGLPWALTVAGVAPYGSLFETGPSLYMDKFIVPPVAAAHVDPEATTDSRLLSLAAALNKPVTALRIFVLDKPRHKTLVADIVRAGARVAYYAAGDAVGTCAVALGEEFDAVMGIGGTPEGLLSACAVGALGGGFFGRFAPQRPDEAEALATAGISTTSWLTCSELVRGNRSAFCAAGITDSILARGVRRDGQALVVETLLIEGPHGRQDRRSVRIAGSQAAHSATTRGVLTKQ